MSKAVKIGILFVAVVCWLAPQVYAAPKVQEGSSVALMYTLEADGVAIIPKERPESMDFVLGSGKYPKSFERQLIGLKAGNEKNVTLAPEEAYGPHRAELVKRVAKADLPPNFQPVEGRLLAGKSGGVVRIAKVLDDSVVLDQNHPLAGKTLKYHIMVKEVR